MPATAIDDELITVRDAFRPIDGADRKYEKCMYYRHPQVWSPDSPQEQRNPRAGWIVFAGNNRDRMADMMERGFQPLRKFGLAAKNASWSKEAQGTPDQYGPWGAILSHADGPRQFPLSQILAHRWYDPRYCPVPGVVWPQLAGQEIVEYSCPDCTDRTFPLALHLARHLRTQHDWTVDDLVKFGEAMGLDFRREFSKTTRRVVRYEAGPDGADASDTASRAAVPPPTVERIVPVRTNSADERKRQRAEGRAKREAQAKELATAPA